MIIWGAIWGAVVGGLLSSHDVFYWVIGGLLGALAGKMLRSAIRNEIEEQWLELRKKHPTTSNASTASVVTPSAPATITSTALRNEPPLGQPQLAPRPAEATQVEVPRAPSEPIQAQTTRPAPPAESVQQPRMASPVRFTNSTTTQPSKHRDEPDALDQLFGGAKNWLTGGNTIVRAGLVILFVGLSFLARYAANAGLLPIELRLTVIALFSLGLLGFGFVKRDVKPAFALALQGAGVAALYLTVFAAFRLYDLMPAMMAFGFMITVCALGCALALLQNALILAAASFIGGFAVPLLLSTGQGSHIGLFSYYTMLNVAIAFIAYRRSWRVLNLIGFVATFGVATLWGVLKYEAIHYESAQLFLIVFMAIYLLTAIGYARNTPTQLGNAVDSTLVFGTPLVGFGLQASLLHDLVVALPFDPLAFAAIGFSLTYLIAAAVLMRMNRDSFKLLIECLIAIGVGFATLAIPLALDAQWTSGVWALEGLGAFWVGMRQARWMPRAFGILLQIIAALIYIAKLPSTFIAALPFANPVFIGATLIAVPALWTAWWLRQPLPHSQSKAALVYADAEPAFEPIAFIGGFIFCFIAFYFEIYRLTPSTDTSIAASPVFDPRFRHLFVMHVLLVSSLVWQAVSRAASWSVANWPSRLSLVVVTLTYLHHLDKGQRVLDTPAWITWLLALVLHFFMLYRNDHPAPGLSSNRAKGFGDSSFAQYAVHVAGVWLIVGFIADALFFAINKGDLWHTAWASVVLLTSSILVLTALTLWAGRANQAKNQSEYPWPLNPYATAYYWHAAQPLAALSFLGGIAMAVYSNGNAAPLPYIPFLNPTDLSIGLAIAALLTWRHLISSAQPNLPNAQWVQGKQYLIAMGALGFLAINTVWLRIAHHFFNIEWRGAALFQSFVVQTGYAILWSLSALALMLISHRKAKRTLWLIGAALLGLVALKLFVIDLSNAGGAERIIAFIAVGLLMLVVGYFVPLPPATATPQKSTTPHTEP